MPNVPDKYQLFNEITGLNLNREDEGLFLKKVSEAMLTVGILYVLSSTSTCVPIVPLFYAKQQHLT